MLEKVAQKHGLLVSVQLNRERLGRSVHVQSQARTPPQPYADMKALSKTAERSKNQLKAMQGEKVALLPLCRVLGVCLPFFFFSSFFAISEDKVQCCHFPSSCST